MKWLGTRIATGRVGWTPSPTPHPILLPVAMSVRRLAGRWVYIGINSNGMILLDNKLFHS